jgi:hypothetical protein
LHEPNSERLRPIKSVDGANVKRAVILGFPAVG